MFMFKNTMEAHNSRQRSTPCIMSWLGKSLWFFYFRNRTQNFESTRQRGACFFKASVCLFDIVALIWDQFVLKGIYVCNIGISCRIEHHILKHLWRGACNLMCMCLVVRREALRKDRRLGDTRKPTNILKSIRIFGGVNFALSIYI